MNGISTIVQQALCEPPKPLVESRLTRERSQIAELLSERIAATAADFSERYGFAVNYWQGALRRANLRGEISKHIGKGTLIFYSRLN